MGKYSSDSDTTSDKYSSKKLHLRKSQDRSLSSDSSSSRTRRRKDKKVRPNRSRSKGNDKSGSRSTFHHSSKLSRHSVSPDRLRRRSNSKDLYRSKRKCSKSKECATRSSRSSLRKRYTKVNNSENRDSSRHRERSDNSSSSSSLYEKNISSKANDANLNKEMVANEHIKFKFNNLNPNKEESTKINSDILSEINTDSFTSKQFVSTKNSKVVPYNIVIDLKSQTIKVPDVEISEPDSIFHPNLFVNEEVRIEKWIKELYVYRQKTLYDENTV